MRISLPKKPAGHRHLGKPPRFVILNTCHTIDHQDRTSMISSFILFLFSHFPSLSSLLCCCCCCCFFFFSTHCFRGCFLPSISNVFLLHAGGRGLDLGQDLRLEPKYCGHEGSGPPYQLMVAIFLFGGFRWVSPGGIRGKPPKG